MLNIACGCYIMKAMILTEPGKIELKDVERPRVGDDEVLVKIKAASICGTDIHLFNGKWKLFTHVF